MEELAAAVSLSLADMDAHPSFIINAFDHDHRIIFWNQKCALHFGVPSEAAIGRRLEAVLPWVATDEKLLFIDRALKGQPMEILRVPYKMKAGHYNQRVLPVKAKNGTVIAAVNIIEEMLQ